MLVLPLLRWWWCYCCLFLRQWTMVSSTMVTPTAATAVAAAVAAVSGRSMAAALFDGGHATTSWCTTRGWEGRRMRGWEGGTTRGNTTTSWRKTMRGHMVVKWHQAWVIAVSLSVSPARQQKTQDPNVVSPMCQNLDGSIQVEQGTLPTYLASQNGSERCQNLVLSKDITTFYVSLWRRHSQRGWLYATPLKLSIHFFGW